MLSIKKPYANMWTIIAKSLIYSVLMPFLINLRILKIAQTKKTPDITPSKEIIKFKYC
jgi:hypothetical protein